MTHHNLPGHLADYAREIIALLGIAAWRISIHLVDDIDGNPSINGACSYHEPYRIATIRLRRDIPDDQVREVLTHELLHVALAPLDHAALTATDLVPKPQRKVARQMIFDGCERAVVALAKALTSDPKRSL
jgi:hypothetical protein